MPYQIPLFGQLGEGVLAEDRRGRITYAPGFVPADAARAWFDELRGAVLWESQRRWMYEREVDVPRLTAHFRQIIWTRSSRASRSPSCHWAPCAA